jgi:hypothetical protein
MGEVINAYKLLFVKPEWKRKLGRTWHRWQGNIKPDL